jgi:hypothetical protein
MEDLDMAKAYGARVLAWAKRANAN